MSKIKTGSVVNCVVREVGQWGAYVHHGPTGQVGFLDFGELAWVPSAAPTLEVGEEIDLAVLTVYPPRGARGTSFGASLKQVHPEQNPWADPEEKYHLGWEFDATVEQVGDNFVLVRLDTGALAAILPRDWGEGPPRVGESVIARLNRIDVDDHKLWATLRTEERQLAAPGDTRPCHDLPEAKMFIFDAPNDDLIGAAHVARLPRGIGGREELFKAYAASLSFPDYFGHNFDALADCLMDLGWIEQHSVFIIHDDVPGLDDRNLKIYLAVLSDALCNWERDERHDLFVAFPKSCKSRAVKWDRGPK